MPGLDPGRGGMASAATNMLLAAAGAGVECVVAAPEHKGCDGTAARGLIDLLEPAGVTVRLMPALPWPPGVAYRWGISPAQITWTAQHVRGFDIVHVHGIWGVASVGGLLSGRITGTPIVVTAHESLTRFDIDGSRSAARRREKLLLKRLYLRYATLFVLSSDLEVEDSLPATARYRTVYYPLVDDRCVLPALRPRGGQRELRVGFLGRIDPKKNLDLLIDALGQLPAHVHLVVGGSGPPAAVAGLRARAARLGVSNRIEWLGFVEPADRPRLLARLDLLAMPSAFESFGLSAAEAMLDGVPVLVSERTGIAELVRRHSAGHLTTPTVPGIVKAIAEIDARRDKLSGTGSRGQAAVSAELSYGRIGQALYDAYQSVLYDTHRRDI